MNMTELTQDHPHYPAGLLDLPDAPEILYARGDTSLLTRNAIGIVGARAATGYGEHVTVEITASLVDQGWAIVSGGAYGIDGVAHRSAMMNRDALANNGTGVTIAYLAGGLDRYYPSGHVQLLARVAERGVVVSEVKPGTPPNRQRFLNRNRLIAAHAFGTVVIEAGLRSGSLHTIGHSLSLGRPTMAVPGPITSTASAGTHHAIRELGAQLVTSADEIIATIYADRTSLTTV